MSAATETGAARPRRWPRAAAAGNRRWALRQLGHGPTRQGCAERCMPLRHTRCLSDSHCCRTVRTQQSFNATAAHVYQWSAWAPHACGHFKNTGGNPKYTTFDNSTLCLASCSDSPEAQSSHTLCTLWDALPPRSSSICRIGYWSRKAALPAFCLSLQRWLATTVPSTAQQRLRCKAGTRDRRCCAEGLWRERVPAISVRGWQVQWSAPI